MMKLETQDILLVGAGGHAASCIDVIEQQDQYQITGLVGLPEQVGTRILNYPVIGSDLDLQDLINDFPRVIIAIGQIKTAVPRITLFNTVLGMGANFPIIISPKAYVSSYATLGAGTIVMPGATINAGAVVGKNCIINSHALIEHHVHIGDHCHISTACNINGGVSVGDGTFVGSGCNVRQEVKIGKNCVIGMGHNLLKDCEDGCCLTG